MSSSQLAASMNVPVTREQFSWQARKRLDAHLYDDSGLAPAGIAIYSLSDPRDVREIRYIGLTRSPRRRLSQHWNTARPWIADETPWWVQSPRLRPLYGWIRELYCQEQRLPVMVVTDWVATMAAARLAERDRIYACLAENLALLNFEQEVLGRQRALL